MATATQYSVTQALQIAKETLECLTLTVIGEVSDVSDKATYKAVYFSVTDKNSVLPCVMWRTSFDRLGITLTPGMLVSVTGKFTLYAAKGRMQFNATYIEEAGEGKLKAMVAARLEMLRLEGLFDDYRKKPIPTTPEKIGVVTSPHGKAVHDVIRTLRRRFPYAEVVFFGTTVEGERASGEIAHAIELADQAGTNVLLVVRGGGSYEDLLPFSSEEVARAIAGCVTPVVTGVGHEPDTTIADYAADLRASTPTAAAEAVTPSHAEITHSLNQRRRILASALDSSLQAAKNSLGLLTARNVFRDPFAVLASRAQTLDTLHQRLSAAIPNKFKTDRLRLDQARSRLVSTAPSITRGAKQRTGTLIAQLEALSPLKVLSRGYSAAFEESTGAVIASIASVSVGDRLRLAVADGEIGCQVEAIYPALASTDSINTDTKAEELQ